MPAKQQAWNRKFVDALAKIVGHRPPTIDWNDPAHAYLNLKSSPEEAARSYAKTHFGISVEAPPEPVLDARTVALVKKTVREVKGMAGMDVDDAVQIAKFQVKQSGMSLLKPGVKAEIEKIVRASW